MKKMKQLIALMLSMLLVVGLLSGCGGGGDTEGGDADRSSLTLYVVNGNYSEGAVKDSVWEYIEDQVDATINITGQPHGDDYYTVLAPIVNTVTDMPDIIFTADDMDGGFRNWSDQATGVLYDIKSLLVGREEEFPHLSKLVNSDMYKNITTDGAYTKLPAVSEANGWGIYYRADWLIKIGYTQVDENGNTVARVPVTIEEFQDVLMKFSDPSYELNPGVQTYGMSPLVNEHALNGLYNAFGVVSNGYYIDENGEAVEGLLSPEYKDFLEWFRMCYENGWIDPQYYNNNNANRASEAFTEGRCGIMMINAGQHVIWRAKPMEEIWGEGTCVMGPPPVGTENLGKEGAGGWSNWGGWWGGYSITKACEDVDAALRLLDYLYTMEGGMTVTYGIEGTHWDWNEDKTRVIPNLENRGLEPDKAFSTGIGEDGDLNYYGKYRFGSHLLANPIDWEKYDETGELTYFKDWYAVDPSWAHLMIQADQWSGMLVTGNLLNVSLFTGEQDKTHTAIKDMCKTYITQAITGEKNLTTDYDALVQACKDMGLEELNDAVEQAAKDQGIIE